MSGEIFALLVAAMWTGSALFFEYASREIKAMNLNLIRLVPALIILGLILFFMSGNPFPIHTNTQVWFWLSLSGLAGFVFGDFFMFSSYKLIPARTTMLIMTLSPPFAAFAGFFLLGEKLSITGILGMTVTLSGIAISILQRGKDDSPKEMEIAAPISSNYTIVTKAKRIHTLKKLRAKIPVRGYMFALFSALGQGVGLVLSKQGMIFYEQEMAASDVIVSSLYIPIASTNIRIISGILFFLIVIALRREFGSLFQSFRKKKNIAAAFGGTIVGPVIGVTLSLMAVQHTNAAIASTIMAIVPIMILIPDRFIHKRKIAPLEIIGAIISVCGVAIMTIG